MVQETALRSVALTSFCQPGPVARSFARTSRSSRKLTISLVGDFWGPRPRGGSRTRSGTMTDAGSIRAQSASVSSGLSGSCAIPRWIAASSSSVFNLILTCLFITHDLSVAGPPEADYAQRSVFDHKHNRKQTARLPVKPSERDKSNFSIIEPGIRLDQGTRPFQGRHIHEVESVLRQVCKPLGLVPISFHLFSYIRNTPIQQGSPQ